MEAMCHTLRGRKSKSLDKGIRKEKRKQKKRGVRSSTFSLRFKEIESLVFIEARGKVHLHDKSFA